MGYQSFPYSGGLGKGLNLRDKPDAVDLAECIDAIDVEYTERGAIATRGGYQTRVTLSTATATSLSSFETSAGVKRMLVASTQYLRAYTASGGAYTHTTTPSDPSKPFTFCRYGTPSTESIYMSNGVDVLSYTGSAFAAAPGLPKGAALASQSTSNRLVSTRFLGSSDGPGGATVSPSHVWFSDPGDPNTWGANNFVQLTPGDGESVMAAATWGELTIVFKKSRFFVFYGNSVDASGNPIFNYRPIEAGVGCVASQGVAVGLDGIYFVAADGLYKTTGQAPIKMSDPVSPLWSGAASAYYTGGVINDVSKCTLAAHDRRIIMGFTATEGSRQLVYDTDYKWFSLYSLPGTQLHSFDGELWFGGRSVGAQSRLIGDDAGNDINAFWRSGWTDFNSPDIKVCRASKSWGAGQTYMALSNDFKEDPGVFELVDFTSTSQPQWNIEQWDESQWAAPQALIAAERRRAVRGTVLSLTIKSPAPWAVHRIDHLIRNARQPGIERS